MKITTKVGLVGFLLALSSIGVPKVEATTSQVTIESRLGRIAKVIREKESQAEASIEDPDSLYLAGRFLNSGSGASFINRTPSFRNYSGGWRNNSVSGWRNGGGGGFINRGGGGGGGFVNRGGGGGFRNF